MRHGSDWYHRYPQAYLGGVQGLTAREHAIYSVVLDLIYAHGGSVNNDPSWISGWVSDMGPAATRTTIKTLCEKGKLIIAGDQITQIRARNEAKTKENLSENAVKNGKKGGKKSAELRAAGNNNKDLGEATASTEKQADKIREDKSIDGDDNAGASEIKKNGGGGLTIRERVLVAMGHDKSGITVSGKMLGNPADMATFQSWMGLGLSIGEIIEQVAFVTANMPNGPAHSFKYFTGPVRELAGVKAAPALEPIQPATGGQGHGQHERPSDFQRALEAGARGTVDVEFG